MKTLSKMVLLAGVLMLATIGACGGGGSGQNPPPVDGISGNGIAFGPITTFGSVVVNGVSYETDTATLFSIDDAAGTEFDLRVGQIVLVKGTVNNDGVTGSAAEVTFDDNVQGPVESIDIPTGQLVVLGQLVIVNLDTSFDDNVGSIRPASLESIAVGDIVEVSGFVAADGSILATRIEGKPTSSPFEVRGIVSNHDGSSTFNINALVVNYSSAALGNNFPGGVISDGDSVEAKGTSLMMGPGGIDEFLATSIDFESPGIAGDAGVHVEIEGLITRFVSAADFDVGGTSVTTVAATVFEGGIAADLGLNIKVEVEGELDTSGVLVADDVDIRRDNVIRADAVVDSVDAANNSLVMLGITFTTNDLTRFEEKTAANILQLTINDISAGDFLSIRGRDVFDRSTEVIASLVEREEDDGTRFDILRGFVATTDGTTTITAHGVSIEITANTIFRDFDDTVITSTEFFNWLDVGSLIEVKGTELSATAMMATYVEFE